MLVISINLNFIDLDNMIKTKISNFIETIKTGNLSKFKYANSNTSLTKLNEKNYYFI